MTGEPASRKHVLIVEDEPDFAALLQSILDKAGYSAAMAHDGDDALRQVRQTRPDLITLDIQMPRQSGALFYRRLKADESLRDIPVIVVTGITRDDKDMETIVRALLEPGNVPQPEGYLDKPVDAPSLLKAVESAMLTGRQMGC